MHLAVGLILVFATAGVYAPGSVSVALAGAPVALLAPVTADVGVNPHSLALGNVNGDTRPDLVVSNADSDSISVLLGAGDGTFGAKLDFAVGVHPKSVTLADFNEDGHLDLATANQTPSTASVLLGVGNGTFGKAVDYPTCAHGHEITTGDFNEDGHRDLAVSCWGSSSVSVLLGAGNGTFAPKTDFYSGSAPHSITVGYFNADGHADLAIANHSGGNISVLLGAGNGTFAAAVKYPVGSGPHSVRGGDFNADGHTDLAVANDGSDSVSVLLGAGNGTFASAVPYGVGSVPKSVAVADLDGDGHLDLVVSDTAGNGDGVTGRPGGDVVSILLGKGDGTFGPATAVFVGPTPFAVITGLLNADTRPDILTANWDGNDVSVLLSDITAPTVSPPVVQFSRPATMTATTIPVHLDWSSSDAGSGLASFELAYSLDGGPLNHLARLDANTRSYPTTITPGHRWTFALRATDALGNTSPWATGADLAASLSNEGTTLAHYTGRWSFHHNPADLGGRTRTSTQTGANVTVSFRGRAIAWVARTSPTMGRARVYLDGVYQGVVDLRASAAHHRQIVFAHTWAKDAPHVLEIVVVGPAGQARVDLDAVLILR